MSRIRDGLAWVLRTLWEDAPVTNLLPFATVIAVAYSIFFSVVAGYTLHTLSWWDERHPEVGAVSLDEACRDHFPTPFLACTRVEEQLEQSLGMGRHHFKEMRFYMALNFGFIVTAFMLGSFDVAVLVLVIKRGFDNASAATKGAVLSLTISATLFGGSPAMLKTEENIDGNQGLYTAYMALHNSRRGSGVDGSFDLMKHLSCRTPSPSSVPAPPCPDGAPT